MDFSQASLTDGLLGRGHRAAAISRSRGEIAAARTSTEPQPGSQPAGQSSDSSGAPDLGAVQHFATLRNEHTRIQFELMRAKLNLTSAEEESVDAGNSDRDADKELGPTPERRGSQSTDPRAQLKRQVAILNAQEAQIAKDVEKYAHEAQSIGRSSVEVDMLRLELKQIEEMSTDLGKQIDRLRIAVRSPSRITELVSAETPTTRNLAAWIENTGIAALLGFLLPLAAVAMWNARVDQRTQLLGRSTSQKLRRRDGL